MKISRETILWIMHPVQQKIIALAKTKNIASMKLREIGEQVGEPHPQKIKHHINQLLKRGFLKQDINRNTIAFIDESGGSQDLFISLPIMGSANCGQALCIADENCEGYLQVSKSLLPSYKPNNFFVLKALGHSMNKCRVNNKSIEDGDYAVISRGSRDNFDNKYVVSLINGMANIKKLIRDKENNQLILVSESSQDYPPIYIHEDDYADCLISGEVVDVIKSPKNLF